MPPAVDVTVPVLIFMFWDTVVRCTTRPAEVVRTASSAVMVMLKKGHTVREIKDRIAVSESYIYSIKKMLAAGVEAEVEPVATKTVIQPSYNPEAGEYIVVEGAKSISEIDAILNERGSRYGNFLDHARITQKLKSVAHQFAGEQGKTFDADQAEAIDMIFHKLGRILNGDPNYADSWIDIAGYAQLVADRLEGKVR